MKNLAYALFLLLLVACEGDRPIKDTRIEALKAPPTQIDRWIRTHLTQPYNIKVAYRFDDNNLDSKKYLSSPKEEVVLPFLKSLIKIWIQPYEQYGGKAFAKAYLPKLFVLVGGENINADGTTTQGFAEGGKRVNLFGLNQFLALAKAADQPRLKRYYHVVHHEFGHILNQNKDFDREAFLKITPGDYISSWFNRSPKEALDLGFISPYASANEDEDFVELLATLLLSTPREVDAILSRASPYGAAKIREKMERVKHYLETAWGIDIEAFRLTIHQRLQDYFATLKASKS